MEWEKKEPLGSPYRERLEPLIRPDFKHDKEYNPTPEVAGVLDRAWNYIDSVPYQVSLRWVFYRLLQDGTYSAKEDYKHLKDKLAVARHRFYKQWRPWTLADESREPIYRAGGKETLEEIRETLPEELAYEAKKHVFLDHFYRQNFYIQIWYEAKAMTGQFQHYTDRIDLFPAGGDASIPYKWQIFEKMKRANAKYKKRCKVLFFGDRDDKGEKISQAMVNEIQYWAYQDGFAFDFLHCGLTFAQAEHYGLPQNPDKPNDYQWESLEDSQAAEIITEGLRRAEFDTALVSSVMDEETEAEDEVSEWVRDRLSED